jgi:ABC-type uncharacterized transport system involved in gliding motility auxiliary subunit
MTRPALLLAVQTLAVSTILGCVVALATLHPIRLDLTPERQFTLSPYTREVLARLTTPVRVTVFYSTQADALRREMAELLARYREARPDTTIRHLDLDRNPGEARRLGVSTYNTAAVEAGDRRVLVELVTEENVTGALLAVAGTPPVPTYFVIGHGEYDPRDTDERRGASEAARALASEGFVVRVLEGAAVIPDDAGLVVLAGPRRELGAAEVDALAGWTARGGALLVLADPDAPAAVGRLLGRFGIELARDVVIDDQARLFGTDGLSARTAYVNQNVLPGATHVQALLPEAQSVRLVDTPGVRAEYLAITAETTWADVDRRSAGEAAFRSGQDRRGPLPVAAVAFVTAAAGGDGSPRRREGTIGVVGDADFVTNLHLNVLGNRDLFLATAGLLGRADPLAAARPSGPQGGTFSSLTLTATQARVILWGGSIAPAIGLAAVAGLLARRRRTA